MTAQKLAASLSEKLNTEAAQKIAAAQLESARLAGIAAAYDAHAFAGIAPHFVTASGKNDYRGSAGTLFFKDATPEDVRELMAAFPAVPCKVAKVRGGTGCRPFDKVEEGAEIIAETCGHSLSLSGYGGPGSSQCLAQWSAQLSPELRACFRVELRNVHTVTPRIQPGHAERYPDGKVIRYTSSDSIAWPLTKSAPEGIEFIRYGRGCPDSLQTFLVYGKTPHAFADMVAAWAAKCFADREHSRAAFELDHAALQAVPMPTADDIARKADELRSVYAAEKLRAGTLEQFAALRMPYTEAARKVAERHWKEYAERYGIKVSEYQNYFSFYDFACEMLQRFGLYEVPITDDMRASVTGSFPEGATVYKYGARWL